MAKIRQDEHLKRLHQQAAATRFLAWSKQYSELSLVISRERDAPDFECKDETNGEIVGLEITTAYYSEQTAKDAWDVARGKKKHTYPTGVLQNPGEELAGFINERLVDKCKKQYNVDYPVLLVVDASPPLADEQDIIDTVLPSIQIPAQVPFCAIHLGVILDTHGQAHASQYWVWQLYQLRTRSEA